MAGRMIHCVTKNSFLAIREFSFNLTSAKTSLKVVHSKGATVSILAPNSVGHSSLKSCIDELIDNKAFLFVMMLLEGGSVLKWGR